MDISSIGSSYAQTSLRTNMQADANKTSAFESALKVAQEKGEELEIKKACQEFESYFLHLMFKEMRKTTVHNTLMPKSRAEEVFQDMLDENIAKNAAKNNSLGLARFMASQMLPPSTTGHL